MKLPIYTVVMIFMTALFIFPSCNKDLIIDTDDFVSEDFTIASEDSIFINCLSLNFPVTIVFPDNSSKEYSTKEQLASAKKEWMGAGIYNKETHPKLNFPIEVTLGNGSVQEVQSMEELSQLKGSCKEKGTEEKGEVKLGKEVFFSEILNTGCATLNFPVSLIFPGDSLVSYAEMSDLSTELKSWYDQNSGKITLFYRPKFVFPLTFTLKDGSSKELNGFRDLPGLIFACFQQDGFLDDVRNQFTDILEDTECFSIQFPVSIAYPDGSVIKYEKTQDILSDIGLWLTENVQKVSVDFRPELEFPLNLVYQDSSVVEVSNIDQLQEKIDACAASVTEDSTDGN